MEFSHTPVLLNECIEALAIRPDGIYVDGTLGGAGHSSEIVKHLSEEGTLIGIDRDSDAIEAAKKRLSGAVPKVLYAKSNYADIKSVLSELGVGRPDGILLDLGVSSFQLDNEERGFSYMHDAPLDMRMDQSQGMTAEDVVNEYSEEELKRIISSYGEERFASRIASFIVKARRERRITSTFELSDIIRSAIPAKARRTGPHPAKRTFQAIRIEVNDELGLLGGALDDMIDVLAPGGRLAVISFHSLEDRIVKQTIARHQDPCTCPPEFPICICGKVPDVRKVSGKPVLPTGKELEMNPRARSAKLRICEKL